MKFLRRVNEREREKERESMSNQFFSLSDDILEMERNHGRRFPVGVKHPEETTRFNRFSIGYSWRILDTARAIKPLEKRTGISEIEKERERGG